MIRDGEVMHDAKKVGRAYHLTAWGRHILAKLPRLKGHGRKQYPPELVAQVRQLYCQGLTIKEVAAEIGRSVKLVWKLMQRHDIQARQAAPRVRALVRHSKRYRMRLEQGKGAFLMEDGR
jgi:hypothetical protein